MFKITRNHLLLTVSILVAFSFFLIFIYKNQLSQEFYKPVVESGCSVNQKELTAEDKPQEMKFLQGCEKHACSVFSNDGFIEYTNVHPSIVKHYRMNN